MMRDLLLGCSALCLCGCAMPQPGASANPFFGGMVKRSAAAEQPSQQYVDEAIDVVTEPPGARIHVNDAFVGHAPVRYTVRRLWRGQPGYMVLDTVKVEALPTAAGQCVHSGIYGEASTKVQSPVTFSMSDCAPAKSAPAAYPPPSKR